ncbi:MAG: hypothetical protein ACLQVD_01505 [Capsulimonadaceae bacterium]
MDNRLVMESVQREQEPNEELLWSGQPNPGRLALASVPLLIFGAFWSALPVFFIYMMLTTMNRPNVASPPIVFMAIPILFLLIGIAMISSPFIAYKNALVTIYAITNRRIMIIKAGRTRSVESFRNINLSDVTMSESQDGSGNLMFAKQLRQTRNSSYMASVGFTGIQNVREAHNLLVGTFARQ